MYGAFDNAGFAADGSASEAVVATEAEEGGDAPEAVMAVWATAVEDAAAAAKAPKTLQRARMSGFLDCKNSMNQYRSADAAQQENDETAGEIVLKRKFSSDGKSSLTCKY